jgi:AraC family transcriptional regulator of adaptative response/methylated-DNA-[protein]-cysteine methyltransferase
MENTAYGDYLVVEKAIRYIDHHYREQPDLDRIAEQVHLSKYHFQRVFSRWAGISPKKFLQYLTISHAKRLLEASRSILDAAYDVGLSSQSRLYDLFVTFEALSPGEFKRRGRGIRITYGFYPSPFGLCLIGTTERGLCWLSFLQAGDTESAAEDMKSLWCGAEFAEQELDSLAEEVFKPYTSRGEGRLGLHLRGTNFQVKVWEALMRIPPGCTVTYGSLAARVGSPSAARAVGNAVGKNPISLIIPCHRVIRETGAYGNYRWGVTRKKLLIGWEAAHWASTRADTAPPAPPRDHRQSIVEKSAQFDILRYGGWHGRHHRNEQHGW